MRKIIMGAVAVAATSTAPAAYALENFTFSFTGSRGTVVTGEIFGLADSGASSAAEVAVDSPHYPPVNYPLVITKFLDNEFRVDGGHITFASFDGSTTPPGTRRINAGLFLNTFYYGNGFGVGTAHGNQGYTQSSKGLVGITFALASGTTSVPEPASIALLGAGLAGISAFRRRRAKA